MFEHPELALRAACRARVEQGSLAEEIIVPAEDVFRIQTETDLKVPTTGNVLCSELTPVRDNNRSKLNFSTPHCAGPVICRKATQSLGAGALLGGTERSAGSVLKFEINFWAPRITRRYGVGES